MKRVPQNEITLVFVRSSGAGGQNVNKTATKAQLHWNVWRSAAFTDEEKRTIAHALRNRVNADGEIVIAASATRSQLQNRLTVRERLDTLIAQALRPKKRRLATQPTRAAKERRLRDKAHRASRKRRRSASNDEE